MSKQKIIPKTGREERSSLEDTLGSSPLAFVPLKYVQRASASIEAEGYEPGSVNVFGNRVDFIATRELADSLVDPQENHLNVLEGAREYYFDYLRGCSKTNGIVPCETSFGQLLDDSYIRCLTANILEFPTDEVNTGKLREYGLLDKRVHELAAKALTTYCRRPVDFHLDSSISCVNSVKTKPFFKPEKEVRVGEEVVEKTVRRRVKVGEKKCEVASHYELKPIYKTIQETVQERVRVAREVEVQKQIDVPIVPTDYSGIEQEAVGIMRDINPDLDVRGATNLFRMTLNLGGGYQAGEALPII